MKFSSEINQSWYVHNLHKILHMLEKDEHANARVDKYEVNLVLHYMVWDHLDFNTACEKAREERG